MPDKNNNNTSKSYLFSVSIFTLAASFGYMAYSITEFTKEIPSVVGQIQDINANSRQMIKYIPLIDSRMGEVNTTLANITTELAAARKLTPAILAEIAKTRKLVPKILKRVDKTHRQLDKFQEELPKVLNSINAVTTSVNIIAKEGSEFRPVLGDLSKQIQLTRNEIPSYFREAHGLVEKADNAGSKASEGAVVGILKGIIKSPFAILKSIVTGKKELTDVDQQMITQDSKQTLRSNERAYWDNKKSGNRGSVTAGKKYQHNGKSCRAITIEFLIADTSKAQINTQEVCRISNFLPWR